MDKAMRTVREINIEAEVFYETAQRLGNHAADALGKDRRSQMTGLENIAESAMKPADILDYIKRQIARSEKGKDWRKPGQENPPVENSEMGFGERLKTYFEGPLVKRRDGVYTRLEIAKADAKPSKTKSKEDGQAERAKLQADRWRRQDIHLRLMRQFIRQMVIQYEYKSGALKIEDQ